MTDADIVFNPEFESEFETDDGLCTLHIGFDVATIALHEFGHFAGLDHTDDFTSRMYGQYLGCRRDLSSHDITSMNQQMVHQ